MNLEELRAEFEAQEPMPEGVEWWAEGNQYVSLDGRWCAPRYNAKWQGYQLRHAKLEARIAELEAQLNLCIQAAEIKYVRADIHERLQSELAALKSVDMARERETAWLIEHRGAGTAWLHGNPDHADGFGWSTDVNRALRFCRKSDAEGVISRMGFHGIKDISATEHIWLQARTQRDVAKESDWAHMPGSAEESHAPTGPISPPKCNIVLRGQGMAYPSTCRECGLGPCKFPIDNKESPASVMGQAESFQNFKVTTLGKMLLTHCSEWPLQRAYEAGQRSASHAGHWLAPDEPTQEAAAIHKAMRDAYLNESGK